MNWHYQITALNRPRLLSRVLQIFDQQQVNPQWFMCMQVRDELHMQVCAASEEQKVTRIRSLLLRLEDIRFATATLDQPSTAEVFTCGVRCSGTSHRFLLAALAAIGEAMSPAGPLTVDRTVTGVDGDLATT